MPIFQNSVGLKSIEPEVNRKFTKKAPENTPTTLQATSGLLPVPI